MMFLSRSLLENERKVEQDGLIYTISVLSEDTCCLQKIEFPDPSSVWELEVPAVIDGLRVTDIWNIAYTAMPSLAIIIIPYGVERVYGLVEGKNRVISIVFPETVKLVSADTMTKTLGGVDWSKGIYGSIEVSHDCVLSYSPYYSNVNAFETMFAIYRRNKGERSYRGPRVSLFSYTLDVAGVGVRLTRYWGSEKRVEVPKYIHGNRVTGVHFYDLGTIEDLILPDTITEMDYFHEALNSLTLPKSLLKLTDFSVSFKGKEVKGTTESADSVVVSDNADSAADDNAINTLNLPESLQLLSAATYSRYDLNVRKVKMPTSMLSLGTFFARSPIEEIVIPDGITNIPTGAFAFCENLKRVVFPDSVLSIDTAAFRGCVLLEEISLPDSLLYIGDLAFYDCTALRKVNLGTNVVSIGYNAFANTGLEEINLPNSSLKKLDSGTFKGCKNLRSLVIPDSITMLPEEFCADSGLVSIVLPDTLTVIEEKAFSNCKHLKQINLPNSLVYLGKDVLTDNTALTSIVIPTSLKHILGYTFVKCTGLKDIKLPDSLISIDDCAFMGCTSIRDLYIPSNVAYVGKGIINSARNNAKNFKRMRFEQGKAPHSPMGITKPLMLELLVHMSRLFFNEDEVSAFCRVVEGSNNAVTDADKAFYEAAFKERFNVFLNDILNGPLCHYGWGKVINTANKLGILDADGADGDVVDSAVSAPNAIYDYLPKFKDYSFWVDKLKYELASLLRGEGVDLSKYVADQPQGPLILNGVIINKAAN